MVGLGRCFTCPGNRKAISPNRRLLKVSIPADRINACEPLAAFDLAQIFESARRCNLNAGLVKEEHKDE